MKNGMKKGIIRLAILAGSILIACVLFDNNSYEVGFSTIASIYRVYDPTYSDTVTITFSGEYTDSILLSDTFKGQVLFAKRSVVDLDGSIVTAKFENNCSVPLITRINGFSYTSRIHSVLRDAAERNYVIILYNEYSNTDGKINATLDVTQLEFICIGELSREEAIDLIRIYYSDIAD